MSIFNEFLPKILDISKKSAKNFDDELKAAFECLEKLEEEYHSARNGGRDKIQKEKLMTTLQSIDEDEGESATEAKSVKDAEPKRRISKKRSKDEVDGISSPEQDKRQKRNASVKAQSIISKQIMQKEQKEIQKELDENGLVIMSLTQSVNVNLTQKLRREESTDKTRRRRKEDGKESALPITDIQIKQEKLSLPPEPMDMDSLPLNVEVKQEVNDGFAMPPPVAPVPKPRRAVQKDKEDGEEEGKRRTRNKKTTDVVDMPPPPVPSARSTRASSRASSRATHIEEMPPPEPRPKRTRTKKKVSDTPSVDSEKENSQPQENIIGEKPRPKRTRRGRKASDKEPEVQKEIELKQKKAEQEQIEKEIKQNEREQKQKQIEKESKQKDKVITIQMKEERISEPQAQSPLLKTTKSKKEQEKLGKDKQKQEIVEEKTITMDETRVLDKVDSVNAQMDQTIVLTNGVYDHAPDTPKNIAQCNATVVLEKFNRDTMVLDKPAHVIMDSTVVIEKEPKATNVTDDNSLLTDDSSEAEPHTPPSKPLTKQPSSAVKEKVQQFEELAARTTRTKTRAMAKMEDQDSHTPPDKIIKPILSAETLNKMNSLIFNGKTNSQISSSASKPRAIPPKPQQPASTSKLSSMMRHREAADDTLKREREDARKKKEAMLEAKREMQKKKREEKMAAAAAVREAAERERKLAMEAAQRERLEKQAHADQGRMDKLKEIEKKKLELARKVAETEERRRAEESARQQRLAEEQRRAEAARKKQQDEAEAMKKEAVLMAREIEKRQKEYMEKQRLKQKLESEKLFSSMKPQMEPVYMADGFQYLNSDEDEEPPPTPVPSWSTSKMRKLALSIQSHIQTSLIDSLFGVRTHSPDLRQIFPNIERARLKRTSSAVWRTPPQRQAPPM